MMSERIIDELTAVGCECPGIINGVPIILSDPYDAATLVQSLFIADEATWLATDLETHAASLQALLPQAEWEAYLAVQTDRIRALRHEAFVALEEEKTIIERIAEEGNFGLFNVAMQNLVATVEAQYPFPGEYS
ncbi:MAG: hypothetical protein P8123_10545 [bacterium]